MIRKLLGMLAVLLIATTPLQGQVYEWVDENGVKHYSNTPPPDGVTGLRTYEELQSDVDAQPPGESDTQSSSESEAADEAVTETPEEPPAESPTVTEPPGAGEEQSSEEVEGAGGSEEAAALEEAGDSEESITPEAEEATDLEEGESGESPPAGRTEADELIAQERDRLEVRMVQLSRQLEEAVAVRDRGSSYDTGQWNKRIEQLRAQIEKEKRQSEARIEQIRNNSDLQP